MPSDSAAASASAAASVAPSPSETASALASAIATASADPAVAEYQAAVLSTLHVGVFAMVFGLAVLIALAAWIAGASVRR